MAESFLNGIFIILKIDSGGNPPFLNMKNRNIFSPYIFMDTYREILSEGVISHPAPLSATIPIKSNTLSFWTISIAAIVIVAIVATFTGVKLTAMRRELSKQAELVKKQKKTIRSLQVNKRLSKRKLNSLIKSLDLQKYTLAHREMFITVLKGALNTSRDGIVILDDHGQVEFCNTVITQQLGYTQETFQVAGGYKGIIADEFMAQEILGNPEQAWHGSLTLSHYDSSDPCTHRLTIVPIRGTNLRILTHHLAFPEDNNNSELDSFLYLLGPSSLALLRWEFENDQPYLTWYRNLGLFEGYFPTTYEGFTQRIDPKGYELLVTSISSHLARHDVHFIDDFEVDGKWIGLKSLVEYKDGKPVRMFQVVRHLSDEIYTNSEFRIIEEFYATLLQSSGELFCKLTPDGIFRFVGPTHLDILGHEPEFYINKNFIEFIHPDDVPKTMEKWRKLASGEEKMVEVIHRLKKADGKYILVRSRGYNYLDRPMIRGITTNSMPINTPLVVGSSGADQSDVN